MVKILADIDKFFNPKSIAVIGAAREPGKVGYSILDSLRKGFSGKIYPINPFADRILGLQAYKNLANVKEAIDLAVVAVPKKAVITVLKDCARKKIKNIVLITSGYSEIGDSKGEMELLKILKKAKTRFIGPNCLGIFDSYSQVDTLFLPEEKLARPKQGGISFISQSGAFGSALLDLIASEGIGVSKFISYGNQAGLKDVDFLEYLGEDEKTKVIVCYIEGVSDGRKFMNIAKRISAKKPVIVFKAGKTEKGAIAAASHTGSLAGSYDVYKAAFKQSGVLEASSIEDIFDFAKALEMQKPAKGKRVAVVTNGGGFGVITADAIAEAGLELAGFSNESIKSLGKILPEYGRVHNPLDLVGDADKERYRQSLDILVRDKNVDGIIVVALLQTISLQPEIVDIVAEAKNKAEKPIVVCSTGGDYTKKYLAEFEKKGVPAFITPERAVKAMWALVKYGEVLGKF